MEHRRRSRVRSLAALFTALCLYTWPVAAHHGWSTYGDTEFEVTGTVETPLSVGGPHATMRIRSNGQVWDVTLAPGPRTVQAGLKEGMIPVGAQVTAKGHRSRDGKRFEIKTEKLVWNGRTFNVYPNRD
jgi:hypothetical protein